MTQSLTKWIPPGVLAVNPVAKNPTEILDIPTLFEKIHQIQRKLMIPPTPLDILQGIGADGGGGGKSKSKRKPPEVPPEEELPPGADFQPPEEDFTTAPPTKVEGEGQPIMEELHPVQTIAQWSLVT